MSADGPPKDKLIGQTLAGRYQVRDVLGVGGMAVVYRAEDANLSREVAVKVLKRHAARDENAAKRLIREARAAASLHHPHIITIHDVGQSDDHVYIVMEMLRGEGMGDLMEREGRVPVDRALRIGRQIASALSVAHEHHIVHRDIKPENVFLTDRGGRDFIKLLDFSIAKLPSAMVTAALTRAGAVFGTPHYMAPEQVRGEKAVTQTDLYALGAVIYELIAGQPPYDGESVIDVLLQHVNADVPRLDDKVADLPAGLSDYLAQLMSKKPGDRPQTALLVENRLSAFLQEAERRLEGATTSLDHGTAPQPAVPNVAVAAPRVGTRKTDPGTADAAERRAAAGMAKKNPWERKGFGDDDAGGERTMIGSGFAARPDEPPAGARLDLPDDLPGDLPDDLPGQTPAGATPAPSGATPAPPGATPAPPAASQAAAAPSPWDDDQPTMIGRLDEISEQVAKAAQKGRAVREARKERQRIERRVKKAEAETIKLDGDAARAVVAAELAALQARRDEAAAGDSAQSPRAPVRKNAAQGGDASDATPRFLPAVKTAPGGQARASVDAPPLPKRVGGGGPVVAVLVGLGVVLVALIAWFATRG